VWLTEPEVIGTSLWLVRAATTLGIPGGHEYTASSAGPPLHCISDWHRALDGCGSNAGAWTPDWSMSAGGRMADWP
jgi:hypothetical protein